jgi:hypothetical protein
MQFGEGDLKKILGSGSIAREAHQVRKDLGRQPPVEVVERIRIASNVGEHEFFQGQIGHG